MDRSIAWRGAVEACDVPMNTEPPEKPARVLLLVGLAGNRKRLSEHLGRLYQLLEPEGDRFPDEPFDLAVVDTAGFMRWHQQLMAAKSHEQPVFLPVMLVMPRTDLSKQLRPYWSVIDEFLLSPIDRSELTQRTQMLLRARRLALAQRSHLTYLVNHDRNTGLPNQNLFLDRLRQAVHDATILNQRVYMAVAQIPLTSVLKSLGARGLEQAACACAARLPKRLRDEFSLARLTTDTWGLLLRAGASIDAVLEICRQVHAISATPLEIEGERVHVAPRIGVAIYPDDAPNASTLMDRAMAALSQADQHATAAFYSPSMQRQALRHIRTETRLHEALEREQFELWLQPKLDLRSRRMVGAEALVRWRLPTGELVPPGDFIAIAEACGLISRIDRWMLEQACAAMQRWRADGSGPGRISVNMSAQQLNTPDLVGLVEGALQRYQLPASALELELTETVVVDIGNENLEKLSALRELGVNIALDDFGTGYCSLRYLHKLPITTLKIDKSFVDDLPHNKSNAAIAQAIVALAKNFGLEIVAEGIENEVQAEYLASLEVQLGQGFLFARPMPERQLHQWLRDHLTAEQHPRLG
jgi:EAL domain-containing protein (putative c-di-GMP-specific phosphodiesterase class I)/GGDEF domain-containing protein